MLVGQAKALARQWVSAEASRAPNFQGACYHGSTNWLPDDAMLPASSDLDLLVVIDDPHPLIRTGKFRYQGLLLEVSALPREQLRSPEVVLGRSDLAGSFRTPGIIADPLGWLSLLQAAVAKDYAKRQWVEARCAHVREKVLHNLHRLREATQFHDQVTAWLFATGVTTHLLLVAGLENPTVRRRYLATRELLALYGQDALYETLLAQLGCAWMSRERVEHHLAALTAVFDATKQVIRTPFPFAGDLSDDARPIAIDGSQALIAQGNHREAIFWIVATYARCQQVLYHDAPVELREQFAPGYRDLLGDLGITTPANLRRRGDAVEQSLSHLWEVAQAIMAANQEITA